MPSFKHPNGYTPSRTAPTPQQPSPMAPGPLLQPYDLVQQNQMLLLQQQEMELQRREMEFQLQQMQLQSYLLQERIIQQQQQQQAQQQLLYGNDQSFVGQRPVFSSSQLPSSASDPSLFRTGHTAPRPPQQKQHQQQNRLSANQDQNRNSQELNPNLPHRGPSPSPRLSFGAGDARASLAASALARRSRTSGVFTNDSDDYRSDVSSPRKSFTLPPTDNEPRRTHRRRASSVETSFSSHNSTIGSNGPTLVLSKPGEYPPSRALDSPTSRSTGGRAKRITVHVQRPSGGHITTESTSSTSSTNSSKSDLNSLDSYTSGHLSVDDSDARSSSTITPKRRPLSIGSGLPAMDGTRTPPRQGNVHGLPPRPSSTCIAQSISRSPSPLGGNRALSFDAIASRQPRGPPSDDDLPTKNFATRIRRKAIDSLRVGGRGLSLNSLNSLRSSAIERNGAENGANITQNSNDVQPISIGQEDY